MMRSVAVRKYGLHDQQAAIGSHRATTLLQDRDGLIVFPIVQHMSQQVSIVTGWNVFEEISAEEAATRTDPGSDQILPGRPLDLRKVEQNRLHLRVSFQDGSEQCSLAAPDVDDVIESGEVVSLDYRRSDGSVHADHRVVEAGAVKRFTGEIAEQVVAVGCLHAAFASLQRMQKMIPRLPLPGTRDGQDRGTRRARRAVAQGIAERCIHELAGRRLLDEAATGEGTQQSAERWRVRPGLERQFLRRERAAGKAVSDAKFGCRIDR